MLLMAMALAACANGPTAAGDTDSGATLSRFELPTRAIGVAERHRLLACSWSGGATASEIIGADGGTISVDGHVVRIAQGAVREPTRFTVTSPAGRLVALTIEVSTVGTTFPAPPVEATITYARCQRQDVDQRPLAVRMIAEPGDGRLLLDGEEVPSREDREARSIDFLVVQRGTYAVAY